MTNMSKGEFEGLSSSHGLQGSNHAGILFGGCSVIVVA